MFQTFYKAYLLDEAEARVRTFPEYVNRLSLRSLSGCERLSCVLRVPHMSVLYLLHYRTRRVVLSRGLYVAP